MPLPVALSDQTNVVAGSASSGLASGSATLRRQPRSGPVRSRGHEDGRLRSLWCREHCRIQFQSGPQDPGSLAVSPRSQQHRRSVRPSPARTVGHLRSFAAVGWPFDRSCPVVVSPAVPGCAGPPDPAGGNPPGVPEPEGTTRPDAVSRVLPPTRSWVRWEIDCRTALRPGEPRRAALPSPVILGQRGQTGTAGGLPRIRHCRRARAAGLRPASRSGGQTGSPAAGPGASTAASFAPHPGENQPCARGDRAVERPASDR